MRKVKVYDTTLRDGTQGEEIAFTVEDKVRIAQKLDELGIHYIEGGWPGSNPRDIEFFAKIKGVRLRHAKVSAFGSTRRARTRPADDPNIQALLEAGTSVVTIFGKSWDLHVRDALRVSLDENVAMIQDSVRFLKGRVDEVIYDAEHFFDGYKRNPEYALRTVRAAGEAGADCIVLCDTNGGTLPVELMEIFKKVRAEFKHPLGIHTHNDAEVAVANTICAVAMGAEQVQGTMNGFGERCGNANLCSIIPNLVLKMGIQCVSNEQLRQLRNVSRFIYELGNLKPWTHQPYVGKSAFAHKGGVHVHAVQRNPETYEHIRPELVGNRQRVLISDLSGKSNVVYKAEEFNIDFGKDEAAAHRILAALKDLENKGYQYEGAEGSFELLMKEALGKRRKFFDLQGFRVIVEKRNEKEEPHCEATIMLRVDGVTEHTAAVGNGPVNALDNAVRKALETFYPGLSEMELLDYKVRILDEHKGTQAVTRVLIESGDKASKWGTVGVSPNIIEASWQALLDSIEFKLHRDAEGKSPKSNGTVPKRKTSSRPRRGVASHLSREAEKVAK
ncbi:MAG: citramalate synthase [Candidatus Tectomicrobia bacterium]|uniref:Citramalate synthase n=1 Tax=Tectimicrobiota bacterium TaxID=2528274 RepID=A0A932GME7_UNCTE|nr:citramalate synthase [Candidatus Tectomicrobia bacterium]